MTTQATIAEQTERLRQYVIEARSSTSVAVDAAACIEELNQLYQETPAAFTTEDIRFLNVLRGYLGARLASHESSGPHTKLAKRKGDQLDHCWRCQTPVDERFKAICPDCDSKAYHWRVCPVCTACGCQRAGKVLI